MHMKPGPKLGNRKCALLGADAPPLSRLCRAAPPPRGCSARSSPLRGCRYVREATPTKPSRPARHTSALAAFFILTQPHCTCDFPSRLASPHIRAACHARGTSLSCSHVHACQLQHSTIASIQIFKQIACRLQEKASLLQDRSCPPQCPQSCNINHYHMVHWTRGWLGPHRRIQLDDRAFQKFILMLRARALLGS